MYTLTGPGTPFSAIIMICLAMPGQALVIPATHLHIFQFTGPCCITLTVICARIRVLSVLYRRTRTRAVFQITCHTHTITDRIAAHPVNTDPAGTRLAVVVEPGAVPA